MPFPAAAGPLAAAYAGTYGSSSAYGGGGGGLYGSTYGTYGRGGAGASVLLGPVLGHSGPVQQSGLNAPYSYADGAPVGAPRRPSIDNSLQGGWRVARWGGVGCGAVRRWGLV